MRHAIYSELLLAMLGIALAIGEMRAPMGGSLVFPISAHKIISRKFHGGAVRRVNAKRRDVKALIPFPCDDSAVRGAAKNFHGVGQKLRHRVERFHGAAGASRQVDDEGILADAGHGTRKHRPRIFPPSFCPHELA